MSEKKKVITEFKGLISGGSRHRPVIGWRRMSNEEKEEFINEQKKEEDKIEKEKKEKEKKEEKKEEKDEEDSKVEVLSDDSESESGSESDSDGESNNDYDEEENYIKNVMNLIITKKRIRLELDKYEVGLQEKNINHLENAIKKIKIKK